MEIGNSQEDKLIFGTGLIFIEGCVLSNLLVLVVSFVFSNKELFRLSTTTFGFIFFVLEYQGCIWLLLKQPCGNFLLLFARLTLLPFKCGSRATTCRSCLFLNNACLFSVLTVGAMTGLLSKAALYNFFLSSSRFFSDYLLAIE